ncbi:hypothetical protein CORC01_12720 [Colletotrichum orchidophilum]|uniref:Uncharacterized protein n=1 Tax=Colletotrichum orchidophilum TaxID=1209926 RepID=A0A1G4AS39_9PEZI|nr:uncharacterized protein CORC01_12720 [Colletotrichum orchidophilum]OHE91984.1 hypothetical protein CORC01_12720 [Colletotrichum orchidophilum]
MPRVRPLAKCTCLAGADPMMPRTSEGSAVEAAFMMRSGWSPFAEPSCRNAGTMLESECGETGPSHQPVGGMQGTSSSSLVTMRISAVP